MFNRMHTRIGSNTFHIDVLPGTTIDQEGAALVLKMQGGKGYATLSNGDAGEVFLGFSTGRGSASTGQTVKFVDAVIPKGDDAEGNPREPVLVLEGTPVQTGFKITIGEDAQTVNTSSATANNPKLEGNRLIFDSGSAGKRVTGYYATSRIGDMDPAVQTVEALGRVGVIASGDICTDCFDVAGDYKDTAGNPPTLKLGSGGKLTTTGSGTELKNVTLLSAPSAETNGFIKVRVI